MLENLSVSTYMYTGLMASKIKRHKIRIFMVKCIKELKIDAVIFFDKI